MNDGPIEAVFLTVDPAKTSGATILAPDYGDNDGQPFTGGFYLEQFGKVESQRERERFVEEGAELSLELDLPFVVVAEEWDPPRHHKVRLASGGFGFVLDQKWTPATILAMGVNWGRWLAEIETESQFLQDEHGHPGILIIRTTPNEWLRDLIPRCPLNDSAARKAAAQRFFEGTFGYRAGADISDAGCIGVWASRSPKVRAAVKAWYATKARKKGKRKSA